jgi:hypothetical protein
MADTSQTDPFQTAEIEVLRARVAQLETQLVELEDWANRAVGAAQERAYWLDRWHLDLNAVMARRSATTVRRVLKALRRVYRLLRVAKRRLTSSA